MGTARTLPAERGWKSPVGEAKRLSKSSCRSPGTRRQRPVPTVPPGLALDLGAALGAEPWSQAGAAAGADALYAQQRSDASSPLDFPPVLFRFIRLEERVHSLAGARHGHSGGRKTHPVPARR